VEDPSDQRHTLNLRVYYEDTDAQGVVYFANYMRFMERGRTEWLRSRGIEQEPLMREQNLCFSLINTNVRFIRPARFDDQLTVVTQVSSAVGVRVKFTQAIHRKDDASELFCSADCEAACLAADTFKPRRLPPGLLNNLANQA
jgi:acyl-CoA thioester hydrolase